MFKMKLILVAILIGICFHEISAEFLRFATLNKNLDLEVNNFENNFENNDLKEQSIVVVSLAGIKDPSDPLLKNILRYLNENVSD